MSEFGDPKNNRRLDRKEAAEYIGVSTPTLASWATRGGGPPYIKLGTKVIYMQSDLDSWLSARRAFCSGDYDGDAE